MKEIHAYRNEDGTYKLEIVVDCEQNDELFEARIVYPRVSIESDNVIINPREMRIRVAVEDEKC